MSDTDSSGAPAGDSSQTNLGELLRVARKARDLTADDLARSLRLEPRIVSQLENNQFDQLPAPAFTRGYVRSIARELNIDSAPLIAILDARYAAEPPPLADFESRAPTQITSDSTIIRYTSVALVIVMIILVALWWRANDGELVFDTTEPVDESAPVQPATPPLDYEFETVTHPDQPFYNAPPEPAALALPPVAAPDAAETMNADTGSELPADEPAAADDVIVISAKEDAWVEVRDALGTRLYYNLVRPGSDARLRGTAPYTLTIGNSPAATVLFRGEAVALEQYSTDGIARFELGTTTATPAGGGNSE